MTGTRTCTVIRALPRLGPAWVRDVGLVSGLLLDLLDEPPPDATPLRPALRAWARVATALRAAQERPPVSGSPCPDLCLVAVSPDDVDTLGAAARALGRAMLPGCENGTTTGLARAASAVDSTPVRLLVALTRMHGVLDLELGSDGELLAGARAGGSDAEVDAARDRVADRIGRMWRAGAEEE